MRETATHATGVERIGNDVRAYCPSCGWKGPRHYGFSAQFNTIDRRALDIASRDGDEHAN